MREFKFRVWDFIQNRMHYESYAIHYIFLNDIDQTKCIIMQYTGLYDKNGKEIYEGDIVEYNETVLITRTTIRDRFIVVFTNGAFVQRPVDGGNKDDDGGNKDDIYWDWDEIEVIGNIHEK